MPCRVVCNVVLSFLLFFMIPRVNVMCTYWLDDAFTFFFLRNFIPGIFFHNYWHLSPMPWRWIEVLPYQRVLHPIRIHFENYIFLWRFTEHFSTKIYFFSHKITLYHMCVFQVLLVTSAHLCLWIFWHTACTSNIISFQHKITYYHTPLVFFLPALVSTNK